VVGELVVGASEVGAAVVGASVVGESVVGASEVGAAVVGASVVGESVVGAPEVGAADVGDAVGLRVGLAGRGSLFISVSEAHVRRHRFLQLLAFLVHLLVHFTACFCCFFGFLALTLSHCELTHVLNFLFCLVMLHFCFRHALQFLLQAPRCRCRGCCSPAWPEAAPSRPVVADRRASTTVGERDPALSSAKAAKIARGEVLVVNSFITRLLLSVSEFCEEKDESCPPSHHRRAVFGVLVESPLLSHTGFYIRVRLRSFSRNPRLTNPNLTDEMAFAHHARHACNEWPRGTRPTTDDERWW